MSDKRSERMLEELLKVPGNSEFIYLFLLLLICRARDAVSSVHLMPSFTRIYTPS